MNEVVSLYRKYLADTGQQDDTDDYTLTQTLGEWASKNNPQLFDAFPDFGKSYSEIREANAPSLGAEFGRAFKSGSQGLASTALGGLSLLTDSDYLREKAQSFEEDAAENAPTVGTLEDIAPGRKGLGSLFSKDALRYGVGKLGSVVPSIGEALVTGAAGAAIGSAVAPGPGTVAGAAEGIIARGLIKSAIKSMLKKGVAESLAKRGLITEASELGLEQAVKQSIPEVADLIGREAMAIGAKRGLASTNLANSFLLNAGDVYSEGADRPTTIALGLVSAIPDSILPTYVIGRLFPGVKAATAVPLAKQYIGDRAMKALTAAGITATEAGTEYFQEAVNVVARNLKDGKDALDFTPEDMKRFREAGITGAFGGGLAAPTVFLEPSATTVKEGPPAVPKAPPARRALAPLITDPFAALSQPLSTEGATTPIDEAINQNAGSLLGQQQDEIARQLAYQQNRQALVEAGYTDEEVAGMSNDEVRAALQQRMNAPSLPTGEAMAGETPQTIEERRARAAAFGLAGAPVPDLSNPEQVARAETEALGRQMLGNVPTPVAPVEAEKNFLPAPAITPPVEDEKTQQVRAAINTPGITYQYMVNKLGEGIPDFTTIDIISPDRSESLASTNLEFLASLGVNLPAVPEGLPAKRYTIEEIRALTPSQPAPILPPAGSAAIPPATQVVPATNAGLAGAGAGVAGETNLPQPAPEVQTIYSFTGKRKKQAMDAPVPKGFVSAGQWAEIDGLRGPKGKVTPGFKKAFQQAEKSNVRLAKAAAEISGKKRGFKFGDHPKGEIDIIDAIQEMGGVPKPGKNSGGEYDNLYEAFRGSARILIGKKIGGINQFTQDLAAAFPQFANVDGMTAEQLGDMVSQALTARDKAKQSIGAENLTGKFMHALSGEGRSPKSVGESVNVDELPVGQKWKLKNETIKLTGVSPDDGSVTLEDGPKYGTQVVPAGTVIVPDKGSLKKPKAGAPQFISDAEMAEDPFAPPPPVVKDAVTPKPAVPVTPVPFETGAVIEGNPSLDFRNVATPPDILPEQWVQVIAKSIDDAAKLGYKMGSHNSSKADTRIALALQAPDGSVVVTGITIPSRTLDSQGRTIIKEPTLQRMGIDQGGKRVVQKSGEQPALVQDVVAAGYKPIAIIHFSGEPTKIHQVFADQQAFDGAWNATDKTQGKNVIPPELRGNVMANAHLVEQFDAEIENLGKQMAGMDQGSEEYAAITERVIRLFSKRDEAFRQNQQMAGDAELPPEYRSTKNSARAIDSNRNSTFNRVMANLQQLGMRVDLFSKEILAQNSSQIISERIAALQQEQAQSPDPIVKQELARRIAILEERAAAVESAAGVTYGPWHIALGMEDVANASNNNLVTLLHEAAESLTMRLPIEQRGAVRSAIDSSLQKIRERAQAASDQSGVPLASETGAHDLIAETLAQEMAAKGISDAPNLAQAIMRWVKDLYYRTAMALQASFGGQPDPETALAWYENQMRREVGGDYSYAFGNIVSKYLPSSNQERLGRFADRTGTPGGIPDFVDPASNTLQQPQVETLNRDALNWNLEFRTTGQPGAELDIPDPEARARIKGGVINGLLDFYTKLKEQISPDSTWEEFFAQIKRPAEEDPKLLLADLEARFPGAGTAAIGGERMTEPMNREAQVELWARLRKLGLSMRRRAAQAGLSVAKDTKQMSENASTINKLESDLRNAALHEDKLKERAKALVKDLAQSIARGRNASHVQGSLAEAIRQEENLRDSDAIPGAYRDVLKRVFDGEIPIFDYIRAIAELDLPLAEMTNREVLDAIKAGAEFSPPLANLQANKPLAVVLATLARKNADQVDQIQLGWLRDTSRFREIHSQLEEIKTATKTQLREMAKQFSEQKKAVGLAARLKASYYAKRDRQEAASERIQRNEERQALLEKAVPPTDARTDEAAQGAGGAQFEWRPEENAIFTVMRQDSEGNWRRGNRVLRFNPDGSAVNGDEIRQEIAGNLAWLQDHQADAGKPRYNQVASQTYALKLLDLRGQQQRTWNSGILNSIDRFVRTPIATARSLGGPAMQRVIQMINRYAFILRNYHRTLEAPAAEWQAEFQKARDASGLKDNGDFINQVYKPAAYFLTVNPGLEEGPAIRQATALVRKGLANPSENFNEAFGRFLRKTKEAETKLLEIAEQYGVFVQDKRLPDVLRRAVPRGWLTGMRSLNAGLVDVITKDMQKAGWKLGFDQKVEDGKLVKTKIHPATFEAIDPAKAEDEGEADERRANLSNAAALDGLLARLFTPSIVGQWLEPFINKPGHEPFSFAGEPIPQAVVQDAWVKSGGNVLRWIDLIGEQLDIETTREGEDPVATFRMAMLRNLDQLFGHEAKLVADASQTPGLLDPKGAKPHALMDARVSDLLPAEHVDFSTYEPESMHRLLARVAYHGAFGRNAKDIQAAFRETMNHLRGQESQFETLAALHTSKAGRVAEAAARGWNYQELESAAKRYREAQDFQSQLEAVLGVSGNTGPLGDFSKSMAIMNFVTGQIVDNPKTAAYNLLSPAMRPFAQRSLGPTAISNTVKTYADILQTGLGSVFESLGLHLFKGGKYSQTIGNAEGRAFSNLPYGVIFSDIGNKGANQAGSEKWLIKPLRILRNLQRKGVQLGGGEAQQFPRLSPIPGLGVINSISQIEIQAAGSSLAREFEQLVQDGIDYLATHPDAANNPNYEFKPSDIYRFKLDHPLLEWWKQKSVEYNLGTLEDIVRDSAKRKAEDPGANLLSEEQALQISMMNQNEMSGNSNITTTPAWLMTNNFLRMTMPLMRWPLWMMSAVHEASKPRAGENAVKPMLRVLGTLALWNLPIGLAFSLLMDEYDKRVLGRKSNLPNLDKTAAIPLVGLPLTMLNSKDPLSQLESMLVRSARAGNIYGLGADFAASTLAGLDPSTGQRDFSLDQRVLAMSQLMNLKQALGNYVNGGEATWGGVARPVLMAMGGNGALHGVDIANNLLGLDNAQSRMVQRTAASNWLRSAAQELDIETKKGGGAGTPTPLSTQTRQMYLAALANDRADFLEAYRKALIAARERVADDPEVAGADREKEAVARVLASWHSRNPTGVLANKPTSAQLNQLLAVMDDEGKQAVRDAMQRYQAFSTMIEPSQTERYFQRMMSSQRRGMDPTASLRRMQSGSLLFSTR